MIKLLHIIQDGSLGPLSLGAWVIVVLGAASTLMISLRPATPRNSLEMWTASRNHLLIYQPLVEKRNETQPAATKVDIHLLSPDVLSRRMMSGFQSGVPIADLIEVERGIAPRAFTGSLDDVGFVDLTPILEHEGLLDQINRPSFSPWTSRGHIFGLPHDVHPVLLAYRADLVEAAGIDVSTIETWDDFVRVMKPLIRDDDGDGRPDHYLLNIWYTSSDQLEVLILQAGGALFDDHGHPAMDSDINARVLATLVTWMDGPNRIAADAPEFSASGNQLRMQGFVIASFMPDWLCGVWKSDMPGLAGKIKLMPLPAWTPGGRRTSVWGGSMLGIPKAAKNFDDCWTFAKALYCSPDTARETYKATGIISPFKKFWSLPCYSQPDSYFCNTAPGMQYIHYAQDVPLRTSSPFNPLAKNDMLNVLIALRQYALDHHQFDVQALIPEAHRLLASEQASLQARINQNIFIRQESQ